MSQATIGEDSAERAGKGLVRTIVIILAIIGIFLVYAYAVDKTDINLEKPLNPDRQEGLLRVLRLLADPGFHNSTQTDGNLLKNLIKKTY